MWTCKSKFTKKEEIKKERETKTETERKNGFGSLRPGERDRQTDIQTD